MREFYNFVKFVDALQDYHHKYGNTIHILCTKTPVKGCVVRFVVPKKGHFGLWWSLISMEMKRYISWFP